MRRPPRLYAIADAGTLEPLGLTLSEGAARMAGGGAAWIQLRGKSLTSEALYAQTRETVEALRPRGVTVIVNDRADVALCAGADGVHLGQDDIPPEEARRLLGDAAVIGFSTHTLEQALRARALPVDYVAIGPLFATATKENPDPVVGAGVVAAVRGALASGARRTPLVGIGGITRERARLALARGCDSLAVVSDLLRDGDPEGGVRGFLAALPGRQR
jgi:thiamine-phosphate pyrophosphorylase